MLQGDSKLTPPALTITIKKLILRPRPSVDVFTVTDAAAAHILAAEVVII